MQIHEITQRRVDEALGPAGSFLSGLTGGLTDRLMDKTPGAAKQGLHWGRGGVDPSLYGPNAKKPSDKWKDKYNTLQKDSEVNSYAKNIAAAWVKQNQTPTKPSTTPATKAKPGQMSSAVAASKPGQNMQKMWGQPKGGIQGMQSDLEEAQDEYTTPSGIVVPAGTKTDVAPGSTTPPVSATTVNQNKNAFVDWSDKQLATRVPETGDTVTMDIVRKEFPDLDLELNSALTNITQTQGTPGQASAIEKYIKLATAGIQAKAQQ